MTPERLYNHRLSNAKRVIGNTFGIFALRTLLEGDNVSNEAELRRNQYTDYFANDGAVGKARIF